MLKLRDDVTKKNFLAPQNINLSKASNNEFCVADYKKKIIDLENNLQELKNEIETKDKIIDRQEKEIDELNNANVQLQKKTVEKVNKIAGMEFENLILIFVNLNVNKTITSAKNLINLLI